jgi:hypothetical protein
LASGTRPCTFALLARPASWRITRSLLSILIGWGLIPVVALIPPHFPWAILAFFGGAWFARRYAQERFTLLELTGECPQCTTDIRSNEQCAFRVTDPIHCPGCRQSLLLAMD